MNYKNKKEGVRFMIILQCNNCMSLDLDYVVRRDIKDTAYIEDVICAGCKNKMTMDTVLVYRTEDNSVIRLFNEYWVSKDGRIHEFKEMSTEYLRNCIELLKKNYKKEELQDSNLFIGLTQEYMLR